MPRKSRSTKRPWRSARAAAVTEKRPGLGRRTTLVRSPESIRKAGPPPLVDYREKRDFMQSPEPAGAVPPAGRVRPANEKSLVYVVQKHDARTSHYDFRLQIGPVLASWAVPKRPSLDPRKKRLAVHVEDHPLEYGSFEGVIPKGSYGAGRVKIWDQGTWHPEGDPRKGLASGKLTFTLEGGKLKGRWTLVKMDGAGDKDWLLVKNRDGAEERAAGSAPARPARLPKRIAPELATLVAEVPSGKEWLHEIKLDGYRVLCCIEGGKARLFTRTGIDWSRRFPSIVKKASRLSVESAWLDGEIVVFDSKGRTSFQGLQRFLKDPQAGKVSYVVFDLLYLDGADWTAEPLVARKKKLSRLVRSKTGVLRFGEHVEGSGDRLFRRASRLGLEGVVSKRRDAPYVSGRGRDWLKIKSRHRQEFVIGGYTAPAGARKQLGALLLGVVEPGEGLKYVGKVGTGFDEATLKDLGRRLRHLRASASPFTVPPRRNGAGSVQWVKPKLVAEVEFNEWTRDGRLRHPAYAGLREDRNARQVFREMPAKGAKKTKKTMKTMRAKGSARARGRSTKKGKRSDDDEESIAGVRLTHPGRVLFSGTKLTKHDLAVYYRSVADRMLPHVAARPLALFRCPHGEEWGCFYQKHLDKTAPAAIRRLSIRGLGGGTGIPSVEDVQGLVALAQINVLEVHPWGARADNPDRPDRIVFDVDPDRVVPWKRIVEAAMRLKGLLKELGFASWVKTSGGRGVHVVVPLRRIHSWDDVKEFSRAVAKTLVREEPEKYTDSPRKLSRTGRIFVDYLRNARGATAVAPYSPRARTGAPVSMPVDWKDLARLRRGDGFHVKNAGALIKARRRDPWRGFATTQQSITKRARKKLGIE